ncbi:aromatic-ring-hydroxylating dioxygenase subunit beta [Pseudorhodoferax sp.]|uniref:aromatic-ring-hydroxylating dioxygenase subunit beta n=1 Tax=Pseudorhodoferax sp. TaxID=1993553 RepID=UPI002DD6683F|nr:aromatic-ring-hydroxylating dioxygenase subunit beta [Pseudorhodoferax sp.]
MSNMHHATNTPSLADAAGVTRAEIENLLYHEANLLDDLQLDDWLQLFTPDGLYWVPIDEHAPVASQGAIIFDPTLRREERVYHLLHTSFPAQSPRSRTIHLVSNVVFAPRGADIAVRCNQVIHEMRMGDFAQRGIGEITPVIARVDYLLRPAEGRLLIAEKKVLLINRDTWQGNLTYIL